MEIRGARKNSSRSRECDDCGHNMPISRTSCPHCGRPHLFPNVALAKAANEKQKLNSRYQAAMADSTQRGCELVAKDFMSACADSVAVFACPLQRLYREIATGTELYETYHDLARLRLQISHSGDFDWKKLRPQAEIELLGSHEHLDKLHYACLSIDGSGLSSYGDCVVQLAEEMIAHRATCFEGNSAVIFAVDPDFSSYLRSEWKDRGIMCVAVLTDQIENSTAATEFPSILVKVGAASEDDRYIEVHIFGPMTARTFKSVRIDASQHSPRDKIYRDAIQQKLELVGVQFEVVN